MTEGIIEKLVETAEKRSWKNGSKKEVTVNENR
jgi:hypothetical protein